MSVVELPLELIEGNDPDVVFTCKTRDTSTPPIETVVNLTGATVELYIKTNAQTADGDATTVKYSTSTTPTRITLNSPATDGKVNVFFTAADIGAAGTKYYRLDVIKTGRRQTYRFGPLKVRNV